MRFGFLLRERPARNAILPPRHDPAIASIRLPFVHQSGATLWMRIGRDGQLSMTRLRRAFLAVLVPGVLAAAATAAFAYQRTADAVDLATIAPEDQPDPGIDFIITGPVGHSAKKPALLAAGADSKALDPRPVRHRVRAD